MYHHWELRVLGTLSRVEVSGYFEIYLLHCTTHVQCLPIFLSIHHVLKKGISDFAYNESYPFGIYNRLTTLVRNFQLYMS